MRSKHTESCFLFFAFFFFLKNAYLIRQCKTCPILFSSENIPFKQQADKHYADALTKRNDRNQI